MLVFEKEEALRTSISQEKRRPGGVHGEAVKTNLPSAELDVPVTRTLTVHHHDFDSPAGEVTVPYVFT